MKDFSYLQPAKKNVRKMAIMRVAKKNVRKLAIMRVAKKNVRKLAILWRDDDPQKTLHLQSGSAAVEFVILAIPLFLPVIMYLTQFAEVSNAETKARSLIREVVRAYVSSENIDAARESANLVLNFGTQKMGFKSDEIAGMNLKFSCSSKDCLTPGGRVRGDLEFDLSITHRHVHVSAQEYVSPWQ